MTVDINPHSNNLIDELDIYFFRNLVRFIRLLF